MPPGKNSKSLACEICGKPYVPHTFTYAGQTRTIFVLVCDCQKKQREDSEVADRILALPRFTISAPGYAHMTLENWQDQGIEPAVYDYMQTVRKDSSRWLVLYGRYGTGKTHIAVAVSRQLWLDTGWTPGIIRWGEFCSRIQQGWQDDSVRSDWRLAYTADILVIDDLDKKMPTPWAMGQLYEVLDFRYVHRKPTICTSNRPFRELNSFWDTEKLRDLKDAIISRMAEMATGIEFTGDDFRFRKGGVCRS